MANIKKTRTYTKRSPQWNKNNSTASKPPVTAAVKPDHLINLIATGVETFTGKKLKPSDVVNIYKTLTKE